MYLFHVIGNLATHPYGVVVCIELRRLEVQLDGWMRCTCHDCLSISSQHGWNAFPNGEFFLRLWAHEVALENLNLHERVM